MHEIWEDSSFSVKKKAGAAKKERKIPLFFIQE